jgi:hypothetical protein
MADMFATAMAFESSGITTSLPVAKDQVLNENDRVTVTPLKIEGAVI